MRSTLISLLLLMLLFFFFNDTATTEIYTLSLPDALPISPTCSATSPGRRCRSSSRRCSPARRTSTPTLPSAARSEEHTSELQSRQYLVCRLLLEKKKKQRYAQETNVDIRSNTYI